MASSLDTVGPLGRCVDDVETVFNVIKGKDGLDGNVKNYENNSQKIKFKIGIPKEFFVGGLDKEIEKIFKK